MVYRLSDLLMFKLLSARTNVSCLKSYVLLKYAVTIQNLIMKNLNIQTFRKILFVVFVFWLSSMQIVFAQNAVSLRRPISPDQPMWLIHIDTWNYADPQKIIDLIPDDIKPFVVMNISLSISHDAETSQFQVAEYGYEIAKSWVRTCAQNQMWAIVQLSSGGFK